MTRIIAGAAGRVGLAVPKIGTRPTSDRVREAMFSALEARDAIQGCRVLDLYAGSGALGLEAVSRGAATAVLVERSARASGIAKKNAALVTGVFPPGGTPVVEVRTAAVLAYLQAAVGPFDLVFSDPPYELGEDAVAADLAALVPLLAPDAVVIVERSSRSPEPSWPVGLAPERSKSYGETVVWTAQPESAQD